MRYKIPVILVYICFLFSISFRQSFAGDAYGDPNDMVVNNHITIKENLRDLRSLLEPVRKEYHLPALAAAVIYNGNINSLGVTGLRKVGSDVNVKISDKFHLGSCTKTMTATLIGMLIEHGTLRWNMTLSEVFPDMVEKMHPDYYDITLKHLLAHQGGFPPPDKTWPEDKSFKDMHNLPGPPMRQRLTYVKMMLTQKPVAKPGTKYIYSNTGYAVVGVIAEQVTNTPWEVLMKEMIFDPLKMETAGFGAMGAPGKIDQPWQHKVVNNKIHAIKPGRLSDNPPVIGPGSTVHCSIEDWAKFIKFHLDGINGATDKLTKDTFLILHTPAFGGNYAPGWKVVKRRWGQGCVLTHTGTNGMNYAVVWMAPNRNFAVLVVSNQGKGDVSKACDKTASLLIRKFLLDK